MRGKMNNKEAKTEVIQYNTNGTCCKIMQVAIADKMVKEVNFIGGCPGNLIGIQNLIKGMNIDEIISRFKGIKCGDKTTSCPDQLARCLKQYKEQKERSIL